MSALRYTPNSAAARTTFHLMSEWTREAAHFVSLRMGRYADLQMSLARCTTPMASFDCMMNFAKQSVTDYAEEAVKAPALLSRMSEEAAVDMDAQLERERAPVLE